MRGARPGDLKDTGISDRELVSAGAKRQGFGLKCSYRSHTNFIGLSFCSLDFTFYNASIFILLVFHLFYFILI